MVRFLTSPKLNLVSGEIVIFYTACRYQKVAFKLFLCKRRVQSVIISNGFLYSAVSDDTSL